MYLESYQLSAVAVLANSFHGATFQRLHAEIRFLLRARLLVYEGIPPVFVASEVIRSRFTAKIAVDALLIDIELTLHIFRPFFI